MAKQEDHSTLPRIYAWFSALVADDTTLMEDLLMHGLPVDVLHPLRRTTALMESARLGRASLVRFLLARGAVAGFLCGTPKGSPLHCAAYRQHWDIAGMLLEHMGVVALLDGYGRTPLHLVCMQDIEDAAITHAVALASACLNKGCPIDALDIEGITALHYCVINDHSQFAALLLARGAAPNVLTPDTRVAPLTIAALEKNLTMAALLPEYSANAYLPTHDGTTPAMLMPQLGQLLDGAEEPDSATARGWRRLDN